MAAALFYPISSVLAQAGAVRTLLAGCAVRLWQAGANPSFGVSLGEMVANEATFSGYPAGGIEIAAWSNPILATGQGSAINGGLVTFEHSGGAETNLIGGFFVVTAGGVLYIVGQFPEPVAMQVAGQGLPIALALGFPSG